jgi:hypothetical protein
MPTNAVGASRGWSIGHGGKPSRERNLDAGSFRGTEYRMKPSTAAPRTDSAAASRRRESGIRSRPIGSASIARATPVRKAGDAGSVNWSPRRSAIFLKSVHIDYGRERSHVQRDER